MQLIRPLNRLLVTGGAGFIGSNFIRTLLKSPLFLGKIVNFDLLTYAANLKSLKGFEKHPRYRFIQGNILNQALLEKIVEEEEIDTIVHFAAESHVDRSIGSGKEFVETNINGTFSLLETVRKFPHIHFHHVSTDEVYGSLGESGSFNERSPYRPNSPYAASKAASDHLVRAFSQTYRISTTLSHCSNNFGPYQYPEKFIPLMTLNAIQNKPLPVYGRGAQIREWIFVEDHVEAVWKILQKGKRGEVYDIGGVEELSNLALLDLILEFLSEELDKPLAQLKELIRFVTDRPGHDFRYAIDGTKIRKELGWTPKTSLKEGLKKTIRWYAKKELKRITN